MAYMVGGGAKRAGREGSTPVRDKMRGKLSYHAEFVWEEGNFVEGNRNSWDHHVDDSREVEE